MISQSGHSADQRQSRSVGRRLKRLEDPRLIVGDGRYLEDIQLDGLAYVALARSPHAHAEITSIDVEETRNLPGVIDVVTGHDLEHVGSVPVGGNLNIPEHPPLARDRVRFVGDPVVAVVAESPSVAEDAIERINIEYRPLPAVIDPRRALEDQSVLVHPEFETNVVTSSDVDTGGVDEAFAAADHRLSVHVGHGRVAAIPMENRGGIAAYDPATDQYTLWLSTQSAWIERNDVASALDIEADRVRVITPDVGGAFGAKMTAYREDILLLALARRTHRPVRWIATRSEDLLSSMHGREAITDGEVAFDADGRIRALRLRTIANLGAYLMKFSAGPPMRMLLFPTGAYSIPHLESEAISVFTNTGPVGPYRGAGRPEAAYFIERVMSDVANALGMEQAEIRRRNFIPADAFPYTNAAGVEYDSGNYLGALERVLEMVDIDALQREIQERRATGEIVGLGVASCVEVSGGGGETGSVRFESDGTVRVITGASPHGQGLETSFAQIVSEELFGVPFNKIEINYGDTSIGAFGVGTMGSRSLQLGGSALQEAARDVREQLVTAAAEILEVSRDDLVIEDGRIGPAGTPEVSLSLAEVAETYRSQDRHEDANGDPFEASVRYQAEGETFPFGSTIALVSIDRETGRVTIERFTSVDDVGNVISPMNVEGQLIGGMVQGMGETLWEHVVYDQDGQLLSGSLMDYALPKAAWIPEIELDRTITPTPRNLLGAKGVGEAGTVHAAPALANAIMDALRPFDVEPLDLPITDEKIWRIIHFGGHGIR